LASTIIGRADGGEELHPLGTGAIYIIESAKRATRTYSAHLAKAGDEADLVGRISQEGGDAHCQRFIEHFLLNTNLIAFRAFGLERNIAEIAVQLKQCRRFEAFAIGRADKPRWR